MAERVGFEPTVRRRITGFQDQLLKPLGHLSILNYETESLIQLLYYTTAKTESQEKTILKYDNILSTYLCIMSNF